MGSKGKNYLKIIYIILTLLLSVLFIPSVHSQEYYANISIDIDESGFVTIDGVTNYPDLITETTEVYTSKKQSYWLLNITKEDVFSDYVFELTLPEGSSINYIKSSGSIRIEESLGSLTVKGFGQNESFSIIVQYQIIKKEDIAILNLDIYVLIIAILLVAVTIFFIIISINKRKTLSNRLDSKVDDVDHYYKGLSERQRKIVDLLNERKRPLTQTEIQRDLDIPKAAISRNINALEIKGLIEREKIGMSNLIRLKKL